MQVFFFIFIFFSRIHYSLAVAKGCNRQVTFSVFKRQLPAIKTTLKLGQSPIDQRLNESILPPNPPPPPPAPMPPPLSSVCVSIMSLICYLPHICMPFTVAFSSGPSFGMKLLQYCTTTPVFLNSSLNPLDCWIAGRRDTFVTLSHGPTSKIKSSS